MKDNLVALLCTLGGFIVAGLGVKLLPAAGYILNYRDARIAEWAYLWLATAVLLYLLGVYGIAFLLRQLYPRRSRTFEPAFLVLGSAAGITIGGSSYLLLSGGEGFYLPAFLLLLAAFCFMLLWTRLACLAKRQKAASTGRNLIRLVTPTLLVIVLLIINYNGFPGAYSKAQRREQWANTKFEDYDYVVNAIRSCSAIINRVGDIEAVAPTRGRNVTVRDPGSSGHSGEFTLEVIGKSGIGIANFSFHIGTTVHWVRFTHRNQTETLNCN